MPQDKLHKDDTHLPDIHEAETPEKKSGQKLTILSGGAELLNGPLTQTDFRPKDMSVRRSRILESIDCTLTTENKAVLPKNLEIVP